MIAWRTIVRTAVLTGCLGVLLIIPLELLRRSEPGPTLIHHDMTYPAIISGVWVNGFEESSFFPDATSIPDRNDPRRYRVELHASRDQFFKSREQYPAPSYLAFRVTFLGRRTRHPYDIDCEGGRYYFFVPDWMLSVRYLGPIADPDRPVRRTAPYKPFKRSGEGGVIRELEDEALARCGGSKQG
jgi:hypothetical protein